MPHTCLIVSDDEGFGLVRDVLASDRRAIFHAPTGAAALRWLDDRKGPTIVVLDLPLADMSGSELVESIRSDSELARRVAVLCLAADGVRAPPRAFRVVRTPASARELLTAIADARRQLAVWGRREPAPAPDRYFVWRPRRGRSALT